ncbi:uncharacterized protein LOC129758075 [Uranotaenia lowii]|uniref:uncharacterized protein LOC129758075 n=1 Tax=Uranotaenia lowii TaxID=190385 RepID=UPI002479A402|nr:uncharacterized protein LOC129758075 [Uranotaenia lowii]
MRVLVLVLAVFVHLGTGAEAPAADREARLEEIVPFNYDDLYKDVKQYYVKCGMDVNKLDWLSSWRACLDLRNQFGTIESEADRNALWEALGGTIDSSEEMAEGRADVKSGRRKFYYIGGTDLGKESSPVWQPNGKSFEWEQIGCQPDDSASSGEDNHKNCLAIRPKRNEPGQFRCRWEACRKPRCYVCQSYLKGYRK